MDNKIEFITEDGEKIYFLVEEEFKLNGVDYLLATDNEGDDENGYIFRVTSKDGDDLVYEIVEDDKELEVISEYLNDILDDIYIDNER